MAHEISIIIPTYNESSNIERLISKIFSILKKKKIKILIIDDNSPDGTGEIAEKLVKKYKGRFFVIHREGKLGLGSAYITGFRHVLNNFDSDLIITMDADFSHDPNYIPRFLKKIDDYDVVVGSRYIKGGGVSWSMYRRILSRGANLIARIILGLKTSDLTGAFRCYRRRVLESLELGKIRSKDFSFFEEILYKCKLKGFSIGEVPIFFVDRKKGKSKLSRGEMIKFFFTIMKLRFRSYK